MAIDPVRRPAPLPFILALALTVPGLASGQDGSRPDCEPAGTPVVDVVRAVRLTGEIELDGVLDESDWQRPGESRLVQNEPFNGCRPLQKTDFWLAYDHQALYIAARMWDTAPDSIAARLGRRDTWPSSDWLYINLDTFNDDRNAFSFSINPAGVLGDSKLYNDGWGDSSWDGVWEAGTRIDEHGWVAEVRIPFSQLKFPDVQDQVWGVNISRRILRHNARDELFHKPRGSSGYGNRFPDLVGINGIEQKRRTELRPYVLGKGEFRDVDAEDPFHTDPQFSGNAGLDLKTALSNNLTMNATVNPDFGQVEVDPAVVNLSAYETFYEERRPFFVEDANVFRFGREGTNNNWNFNWMDPLLFYSRRVGRAPQLDIEDDYDYGDIPDVTTILGAVKVSGKIDRTDVGGLTAVTAREKAHLEKDGQRFDQVVEPLTNYTVARAKIRRPDGSRGLGIMATGTFRDLDDPVTQASLNRRSITAGLDGWLELDDAGVWAMKGYLSGSHIKGSEEAIGDLQLSSRRYFQRPDATHTNYDPEATELKGWIGRTSLNKQSGRWRLNAAAGYSSPGYEVNDVGFQYRTDTINTSLVVGHRWLEPNERFRAHYLDVGTYKTWDTGGHPDSYGAGAWYTTELANYWVFRADAFHNPERNDLRQTRGGPAMRAPRFWQYSASIETDRRKNWVVSLSGGGNQDAGGTDGAYGRLSLELHPTSSFGLALGPEYYWDQYRHKYYDQVEDPTMVPTYGGRYVFADLEYREFSLETRFDWTLTPKLTIQAYLQPLFASGRYTDIKELAAASTYTFNRYGQDNGSTIVHEPDVDPDSPYLVTPDGSNPGNTFRLPDKDFNFKSLKVNMVLRWEYQPGSTFYLVWTQDRVNFDDPGSFDLGRDARSLFDSPGEHVIMAKLSHYFSL